MLSFKNESWLTKNTEILTTTGWLKITDVELGMKVMGKTGNRYVEDTVYSIGKCNTQTIIKEYSDFLIGKNICFSEERPIQNVHIYNGPLINLKTGTNTLIVRCFKEVEDIRIHNDDYHIIWTAR